MPPGTCSCGGPSPLLLLPLAPEPGRDCCCWLLSSVENCTCRCRSGLLLCAAACCAACSCSQAMLAVTTRSVDSGASRGSSAASAALLASAGWIIQSPPAAKFLQAAVRGIREVAAPACSRRNDCAEQTSSKAYLYSCNVLSPEPNAAKPVTNSWQHPGHAALT